MVNHCYFKLKYIKVYLNKHVLWVTISAHTDYVTIPNEDIIRVLVGWNGNE